MKILLFLLLFIYSTYINTDIINLDNYKETKINIQISGNSEYDGFYELETYSTIKDLFELININDEYDISQINQSTILKNNDLLVLYKRQENHYNDKISINNANIEQLDSLPGIGESTAKKIISYREKNGLFNSIEQLMNIEGIKQAKFDKLKDNICL